MISDTRLLICEYPAELALVRRLAERNYFAEIRVATWGGLVPRGLSGAELMALSKEAEKENQLRFKEDPLKECARRGAL